ncbi:YceI family protein [Rariglobus hedericola]|uniref:YceI family protein n=1 Tax=Rariglobus hedericola TaxID=2597822 RepID=A0A556QJ62_9BACT|nr:YceI family protein [Rariglobus hedericola]TSJ76695.1 YceI family protein [Rariglobus hedericola]
MKLLPLLIAGLLPVFAIAAPSPLAIDPGQSHIEIAVKATAASFTGKLDAYTAVIAVESGHVTSATFTFNFADVRTGKEARDEAMNEWQETPKYPKAGFTLKSIDTAADGKLTARGVLTLHNVARAIAFPLSITSDQKIYAIDGHAVFDTRDFGLPIIRKFGLLKVDPLVEVHFHLQGSVNVR